MKRFGKLMSSFLTATLMAGMVSMGSVGAVYADDSEMEVTIRIEGISENLYYDTIRIPYTDSLTVAEALAYADEQSDRIVIRGLEDLSDSNVYVSAVNEDAAARFGGWDGWLYMVNDISPSVGMNDYDLKNKDVIVLYYGDPYGVGMQFPQMDTSDIQNGVLRFKSEDTTYDENWNPIVTTNPIVDMEVTIGTGTFKTDAEGKITLDAETLAALPQKISISKVAENGCPLVLRMSGDMTVAAEAGDFTPITVCVVLVLLSGVGVVLNKKSQEA